MAKIYTLLFTSLILLITGCSVERNLKLDARVPLPPAFQKIPLHIGVYYSPEFVEYTKKLEMLSCGPHGRRDRFDIFFIFPIGAASKDLFDQITASMFTKVTVTSVPSRSLNTALPLDEILEPEVDFFKWDTLCSKDYFSEGKMAAAVGYTIRVYGPDGRPLTKILVKGLSIEKPKLCFRDCRDSLVTEKAIQDAMAKFMVEFPEQPAVRQWLSTAVKRSGKVQ
jgi:hypothetical protein